MSNVHIYAPESSVVQYRVLEKRCRIFAKEVFTNWRDAFEWGLKNSYNGFRVFRQLVYGWYDSTCIEILKVSDRALKK